jgi:hypothetical protein
MSIIVATSTPIHNKLQHKLAGISPMEEKIKAKIETAEDRLRDEMIDTLAELVRIPFHLFWPERQQLSQLR